MLIVKHLDVLSTYELTHSQNDGILEIPIMWFGNSGVLSIWPRGRRSSGCTDRVMLWGPTTQLYTIKTIG